MAVSDVCRRVVSLLFHTTGNVQRSSVLQNLSRCLHSSSQLENRNRWKLAQMGVDLDKYTLEPIPLPRTGGRGPDGRIWTRRIGGGDRKFFRMVDYKRNGPTEGNPMVERVQEVLKDDLHTANIAIVAGGSRKRYIIATQNMKAGDLIKTSSQVTRMPVRAAEGDAYPVGSLPLGTIVHNVEIFPQTGGVMARAAGTSAQLLRKIGDRCILRLPSKREMEVAHDCMATVGRVSNIDHNKVHIGKAGNSRRMGIRPSSGWWQRKTGYNGRKIKPPKALRVYTDKPAPRTTYMDFDFQ